MNIIQRGNQSQTSYNSFTFVTFSFLCSYPLHDGLGFVLNVMLTGLASIYIVHQVYKCNRNEAQLRNTLMIISFMLIPILFIALVMFIVSKLFSYKILYYYIIITVPLVIFNMVVGLPIILIYRNPSLKEHVKKLVNRCTIYTIKE